MGQKSVCPEYGTKIGLSRIWDRNWFVQNMGQRSACPEYGTEIDLSGIRDRNRFVQNMGQRSVCPEYGTKIGLSGLRHSSSYCDKHHIQQMCNSQFWMTGWSIMKMKRITLGNIGTLSTLKPGESGILSEKFAKVDHSTMVIGNNYVEKLWYRAQQMDNFCIKKKKSCIKSNGVGQKSELLSIKVIVLSRGGGEGGKEISVQTAFLS